MAGCSLAIGGPQSNYHPDYVAPMINAGFASIASGVAASLGEWLECFESSKSNCVSSILGPCAPIDSAIGHRFSEISLTLDESAKAIQCVPYSTVNPVSQPGAWAPEQKSKRSLFSSNRAPPSQAIDVSQQSSGLLDMAAFGMGDSFFNNNNLGHFKKQASNGPPPLLEFDPAAFGLGEIAHAPQVTEKSISNMTERSTDNRTVENGFQNSGSNNHEAIQNHTTEQKMPKEETLENGHCNAHEQPSNNMDEVLETCIPLGKSAVALGATMGLSKESLSEETSSILARYSDPTSTRVNVAEVAEILGIPEMKFGSSCSMLLSGLASPEGPAGRLDSAGNVMLAGVRVATAMSICLCESSGEEANNFGYNGVQFNSLTKVQSFQSLPSVAASWSTCMVPDPSTRGEYDVILLLHPYRSYPHGV